MPSRRHFLLSSLALAAPVRAAVTYPPVVPRPLVFPRDHGAHPDYRTEWWYLTGWLDVPGGAPVGFQVTFFRTRTEVDPANPSAFAAKQLIIAHAALADPARATLLHDERIARTGLAGAGASEADTAVHLGTWSFERLASGDYRCALPARGFTLEFTARPKQPLLLQGDAGFSRKGPSAAQASYYYSQPQLQVQAQLARDGRSQTLTGSGWLDHEWSSTLLTADAAGWDWIGMNLEDGSALTAFQIRRQGASEAPLYAYASLRPASGTTRTFSPEEVRFVPRSQWTSPRTRAMWPVAQEIHIAGRRFATRPLMNDQELDSRMTTGAVYWEGASELIEGERRVGRGYLEMTGYVAPIRL
ncbi:MAG: lipocalin-like domain-containing protein [Burkholderiaceae bacterium]